MKLSVATNWDDTLLHNLHELNLKNKNIGEVFGSLRMSVAGSGRGGLYLPEVSVSRAERHIELVHKYGMEFTYTVNAPSMANLEYSKEYHLQLLDYFDLIRGIGADTIVLTIPYLVEIVKKQFPELKVKLSVIAHVDSAKMIVMAENMGVDGITIDFNMNRDFDFLEHVIRNRKCELELLAGDGCLYACIFKRYHYDMHGHGSRTSSSLSGLFMDYCFVSCLINKHEMPAEIIKSRWIRPEDIEIYEKMGFRKFKIGQRTQNTEWNTRAATAYSNGTYEDNLLEIIGAVNIGPCGQVGQSENADEDESDPHGYMKYFPEILGDGLLLHVDNARLDGFLDYFITERPRCYIDCHKCNYCEKVAERAIEVSDRKGIKEFLAKLKVARKYLITSEVFKNSNMM